MAIKDKKKQSEFAELPPELDSLVRRGFTEQFMSDKFERLFKETKEEVLAKIEKSDEVELTKSTALKTKYGSINLIEINKKTIDKDALFEHLATLPKDKILALLVNAVSTFNNDNLEKELSREVFEKIATVSTFDQFKFTATSDFKAQCEAEFSGDKPAAPVAKEVKVKVDKKQVAKAAEENAAISKAKAAAAKAKAAALKKPKKSADDDLDAILGGE